MAIAVAFYFIHWGIITLNKSVYLNLLSGAGLLAIYCWFIATVERKELEKLPGIGKYFSMAKP